MNGKLDDRQTDEDILQVRQGDFRGVVIREMTDNGVVYNHRTLRDDDATFQNFGERENSGQRAHGFTLIQLCGHSTHKLYLSNIE